MSADSARLNDIYAAAMASRHRRAELRRQPPFLRLWDGDWQLRGIVAGEYEATFEFKLNDTGAGHLVLPLDHHLAEWAITYWQRKTANIHITVDKDGARWSGRMTSCQTTVDEAGVGKVTLTFAHDFEELNFITVWANPFLPAAVQFPKTFILAGPAAYMLKLTLFVNLLRLQGNLWALPDDPLSFSGWTQGLDYRQWPILVKPSLLVKDASPWTILNSRFKTWRQVADPILADAHLMVTCRRWLVGDPQPWPGAGLIRNGQLIIDIVDKSGWWEQTSTGGTIVHGLVRTGLEVADNLVDEARAALTTPSSPPEYSVSGFLGTAPSSPWVVYRAAGEHPQVTSSTWTHQPATVSQIIVGGHSMPGVNETRSIITKLIFNILGSFFLQPGFGSIADSVAAPLFDDVLLAFMTLKSPVRTLRSGWSHYYEDFVDGADKAYTLSSIMAIRQGLWESRERFSHQLSIADGAPYLVGDNGQGHFFLGDRVGATLPGAPDGYVAVEQVTSLSLAWTPEKSPAWSITLGDPRTDESPITRSLRQLKGVFGALHDIGVM